MVPTYLTVSPGGSRDYTSGKAAKADWDAGVDFRNESMMPGTYVSNRDVPRLKAAGVKAINIRFKQMQNVKVINL